METPVHIGDLIFAVSGILTAIMVIAGIIVRLTKTKKDDEVFEEVKHVVEPVLDAVNHKTTEKPPTP